MARDFSELNKYAKREYKFVQADSFRLISQGIESGILSPKRNDGVCMGATLMWINEKLSTSNSYIKSGGRLRGSTPREFANSINPVSRAMGGLSISGKNVLGQVVASNPSLNQVFKGKSHARNEVTMRRAADVQARYAVDSVEEARKQMNFIEINSYAPRPIEEDIPQRPDRSNMLDDFENEGIAYLRGYKPGSRRRLESDTIAKAAFDLPTGLAILIEVNNAGGNSGHAIAFYRSRPGEMGLGGKTLYFFDSNAGVYKLANDTEANIKHFIEAWLRVYSSHIKPVIFETAGLDWCRVFKRRDS
jgi:hypothetical protein